MITIFNIILDLERYVNVFYVLFLNMESQNSVGIKKYNLIF